ncbi:hypothetical protein HS088_TW02G01027 [Tripterygium wilfordii]|uniref:DUF1279 domain-containing protein n=1 Tax=Tripterygium wilfordii TaxID=458696 RepID=A0A7J7E095_TRIWF|nr:uncharacterized protein LOC120015244 [Tripterygium wilfordii]KAF5752007.1 hypothetical protein HS088_TW02G01027 [Tripterygium wilfordii]
MGSRVKQFLKKYGGVAVGVHASVSAFSIAGLYIAIKNNIDVNSYLEKWNVPGFSKDPQPHPTQPENEGFPERLTNQSTDVFESKETDRTAEIAKSAGGALALAFLCNKALFPIRAPITLVLTPPVTRFLAKWKIPKASV